MPGQLRYSVVACVVVCAGLVWASAASAADSVYQTRAGYTIVQPLRVTTTKVDDQQITLTTPPATTCTAPTAKFAAALTSTKIPHSRRAKLKFSKVAFYIGKGVKHTHHRHGRRVVTYTPNATAHHVPARVALSPKGLEAGTHTLNVIVSYKLTKRVHGHTRTGTVTDTIKLTFTVC